MKILFHPFLFSSGLLTLHHLFQPSLHIHLLRMPNPLIIPKHHRMRKIYHHKDRNAHIRGQKARGRPLAREEDYKPIQQTQQREHHQGDVIAIRLHEGLPRHLHVLSATRFAEAQIDDAAADPADEARGVGQIDEPVEDDRARATTVEVSEGRRRGRRRRQRSTAHHVSSTF